MTRQSKYIFMLLTFLAGCAPGTYLPLLSLFLTEKLHASPFEVGLYFTMQAVLGIVVSQVLARLSDGRLSRVRLVQSGAFFGILAALGMIFIRDYWLLLFVAPVCMSVSFVCSPQIFAAGREYGIRVYGDSVMFTSVMRTFFSLAWVVAPVLSYWVATAFGYEYLFSGTAVIFMTTIIMSGLFLPDTKEGKQSGGEERVSIFNRDTTVLFLAVTALWLTNNLYLISMPVYIKNELLLNPYLPSYMMATAALLEIPVMLISGKIARAFGIKKLMYLCGIAGCLFYGVLISLPQTSETGFILVQIFNAVYIGILAGIGMIYFQELLPKVPGQATTLFNNAAATGAIMAGPVLSAAVGITGFYGSSFGILIILTVLATGLLVLVRDPSELRKAEVSGAPGTVSDKAPDNGGSASRDAVSGKFSENFSKKV